MEEAQKHAEAALKLEPDDYYNNWIAAACHLYLRQFDKATAAYDKALELAKSQAIPDEISALRIDRAEMLLLTDRGPEALKEIQSVLADKSHTPRNGTTGFSPGHITAKANTRNPSPPSDVSGAPATPSART
jgi:Uncharacterized enzyme of heme biosynthesis